jgi:hypothetical protein
MAATAKDAEIREQWTELAEQWRQRAEADEHQDPLPVAAPQAPALVPEATTPLQQEPVAAPQAPTLVPEATTPRQQKPVAVTSNSGGLDDVWAKIAAPINLGD